MNRRVHPLVPDTTPDHEEFVAARLGICPYEHDRGRCDSNRDHGSLHFAPPFGRLNVPGHTLRLPFQGVKGSVLTRLCASPDSLGQEELAEVAGVVIDIGLSVRRDEDPVLTHHAHGLSDRDLLP